MQDSLRARARAAGRDGAFEIFLAFEALYMVFIVRWLLALARILVFPLLGASSVQQVRMGNRLFSIEVLADAIFVALCIARCVTCNDKSTYNRLTTAFLVFTCAFVIALVMIILSAVHSLRTVLKSQMHSQNNATIMPLLASLRRLKLLAFFTCNVLWFYIPFILSMVSTDDAPFFDLVGLIAHFFSSPIILLVTLHMQGVIRTKIKPAPTPLHDSGSDQHMALSSANVLPAMLGLGVVNVPAHLQRVKNTNRHALSMIKSSNAAVVESRRTAELQEKQ